MSQASPLRDSVAQLRLGLLLLLVGVALVLDFVYFSGYFGSDDVSYLRAARQFANLGTQTSDFEWRESFATTRLAITVPDGFVYWVTGGSIALIAWFHVLYHLALVVLAYLIGREVWDESTGLVGAGLVATSPVLYVYTGGVLPDNATAVWLAVLLLLLLRLRRRAQERPLTWREAGPRYAIAGFVLGLAYSCKETAIIMTVPSAVVIMASAPKLRSWVWVRDGACFAAGLVAFLLCEAVVLRLLTDAWSWRLGGFHSGRDPFAERMKTQGTLPFDRFAFVLGRFRGVMPLSGLALLVAALVAPFVRRRRDLALLAFFWWPLLYLTIGTTSFSAYRPSSLQVRYYAIAILPAAVMAAMVVRVAVERWSGRGWTRRATILAIAAVTLFEARSNRGFAGRAYHAEHVRGFALAYETARMRYPSYPIVLSKDFMDRMTPVLFPGDPDPKPEATPFLLLSPVADALPEGPGRIKGLKIKNLYVRTIDIVFPPQRRWDVLVDGARRWFGVGLRPPVPTSGRGAAAIQLVTTEAGDEPPRYQRLPLFAVRGDIAVTSADGGNHVAWRGAKKLLLQHFDAQGLSTMPVHPAAQLAAPAARVRVELDVTAGQTAASLIVYAIGYDASGAYVQVEQPLAVDPASPVATASLQLAGTTPLVAVRVRVRVQARAGGAVYVGNPRITPLP